MKARFEVSTEGMRALHAGREPWQLAKELVSNAWDEAITRCNVELKSISPRKAKLSVYDDGKGFADIRDSYTLMGHTPKRGNPTVRGRFNIGEKEILSVADAAVVHTKATKVVFPKKGGRQVRKAMPIKGTVITCTLPWGTRQVESTIEALRRLIVPEGITYTVNEQEVPHLKPYKVIKGVVLETVLQDSPTEPLRTTKRKTSVELYKAEKGMLYELGIPVQPIECPFLVNIMQKVPMPPNRDVVRDSYLQDVYRIVLEATKDELENPSDTWVRQAVEDKEISPEAVKEVMTKRYGDKAVLWSASIQANERAEQEGYTVVHARTLSADERAAMENVGLVHSSEKFGLSVGNAKEVSESEWTEGMRAIRDYIHRLGKELLREDISMSIYRLPNGYAAAEWNGNHVSMNLSKLGRGFFEEGIEARQTGLILHEFAHYQGQGHNWEYQKSLQALAGKAVHLALEKPEVFKERIS